MITVELDLTSVVVATVSAGASILATWYFSKRRYVKTHRPVTENDIALEGNKNGFRLSALISLLVFLSFIAMVVCTARQAEGYQRNGTIGPATSKVVPSIKYCASTESDERLDT